MKCAFVKPLMRRRNIVRLGLVSLALVIVFQSHLFTSKHSTWVSGLNIFSNDRLPRQDALLTVPVVPYVTGKDGIEQAQNNHTSPALSKAVTRANLETSKKKRKDKKKREIPDVGVTKDPKYLVYLCEAKRLCGGWGDRQRGITSLYILALLTDRQFKIVMNRPCDITNFYAPARVPWIADENELRTDSTITLKVFSNRTLLQLIRSADFNSVFPQKVVYMKTNRELHRPITRNMHFKKKLVKWGLTDSIAAFRWAWRELMQPTKRLSSRLEHQIGTQILMRKGLTTEPIQEVNNRNSCNNIGNSTLICAHVRLCKNPTMPMDSTVIKFRPEDIPPLFDFMISQDDGNSRYFVATDAEEIRKRAQNYFGTKSVAYEGDIVHVDLQAYSSNACSGFEVALTEQLILSLCDILVMSDSTFSRHASYMSTNTSVYSIVGGKAHFRYRTDGPIV